LALELKTGRQLWSFAADEISEIRADDQRLYVMTHKGSIMRPKDTLHALALSTRQEKWSHDFSGSASDAVIEDGAVYAGREHLHAIDSATGKELWSFKGTGRESARLISGGRGLHRNETGGPRLSLRHRRKNRQAKTLGS
jgi:outer membrane protein assembly factor BamB